MAVTVQVRSGAYKNLTKAEASEKIEELQEKSGRLTSRDPQVGKLRTRVVYICESYGLSSIFNHKGLPPKGKPLLLRLTGNQFSETFTHHSIAWNTAPNNSCSCTGAWDSIFNSSSFCFPELSKVAGI